MNNVIPNMVFGFGTWTHITNRFLYCANSAGTTGGDIKIFVSNLPAHSHSVNLNTGSCGGHTQIRSNNIIINFWKCLIFLSFFISFVYWHPIIIKQGPV